MPAPARDGRAVVAATRALTPEVLEADLRLVDPPALPFAAGQWVSVPLGPRHVRAYSIASTPATPSTITLAADVAPAGPGSAWFRGLAPGSEVRFKGPLGGFVFSRADPRRPLFVAEEIGIVPVRAMLLDLYATGFGRPTILVYWARDPGWLVYDADLRSLARRYPGFVYRPVIGTPIPAAVDGAVATTDGLIAYVAGGAATITAVRETLMARGMERKAVKWEKFYG